MANLRPCPAVIDGEWEPDCDNCSQLITYIKTLCDDKGDDEREKTLNEATPCPCREDAMEGRFHSESLPMLRAYRIPQGHHSRGREKIIPSMGRRVHAHGNVVAGQERQGG